MPQSTAMQQTGGAPTPPAFHPQIVRSVRMHPQLAGGVALAVFLLLAGFALTRHAVYNAESLVYEEPAAPKLMSDGTPGAFDSNRYDSYLQQQMLVVTRPDVMAAAVATLPTSTWRELGPTPQAAAASLAAQLKVQRVTTSYQLSISLQSPDPVAAAAIVNAATTAYLEAVRKDAATQTDQRVQLLAEERRRIEGELETTRAEQAGLSAALGVASPLGDTGNPYDFELASLRQQLLTAREAHDASAAQLGALSGDVASRNSALTAAADEVIGSDAGLSTMRASVSGRRALLNGQMAGMKPDNPVYKQDLDELTELDKTLDSMTAQLRARAERQLQQKLRTDLERTGDIESRLNAQLAQLTTKATGAAPKLQRASELATDLTRLNTRYAAVDDALRSLQLEANGPGVVRLSLAATVPASPEPSKKMLLLAAAPLLALLFGITAAVLARKRDRRVYSGHDIEDLLGFPPIAVLPARGDVSARVLEEYVLRLAAGIESAYRGNGAQTFLLTAVSSSTDIRPLRNALTGKLERIGLDVAVARTTDLMVAGPEVTEDFRHELTKPGEGASDGFVSVHLAKLKAAHALVVIDAPALGTSAETEYVARCADATVLIAECGVTTREELLCSAKLLERLHARGIGVVLQELHLRYADSAYRDAISAFEQRQPDHTYLNERDTPYPMPRRETPVAEPIVAAVVSPVAEPVAVPVDALVEEAPAASLEVVKAVEEPSFEEEMAEPIVFRHRGIRGGSAITEAKPLSRITTPIVRKQVEYAINRRDLPSREKMAPTLSALREQTPAGETSMSTSKNWFQRLLHRDEEKVSIIPDGDDEGEPDSQTDLLNTRISRAAQDDESLVSNAKSTEPMDEGDLLASRISRSVQSYELPVQRIHAVAPVAEPMVEAVAMPQAEAVVEPVTALFTEPEESEASYSRRFVLEDLHPHENAVAEVEHAFEDHDPPPGFEAAAEMELAAAHDAPERDSSDHFRIPLELIAPWQARKAEHRDDAVDVVESAPEHMPEPVAKPRPARPLSFHELAGSTAEETAAERTMPDVIAEWTHPVEEIAAEPAAAAAEVQQEAVAGPAMGAPVAEPESATARVEEPIAPPARDPYAAPVRDPFASPPAGTSRWDPIPPLRPRDSGWDRIYGVAPVEPRHSEEWNWTSRDHDGRDYGKRPEASQHWEDEAPAGELEEPALSRPWGLLSRFQQANLITPARRTVAPEDSDDSGIAQTRPGSFQSTRKG